MLYIKNGMIIDPVKDKLYRADLQIEEGRIARIIERNENEAEDLRDTKAFAQTEVLDAAGLMIAPGLADTHVHFRDPGFTYKEDIHTGARAAARGGFTQIVLMANTKPAVDNPETLSYVLDKGKETGIHINSCANVTLKMEGKALAPMELLAKQGAAGFTDDGIPLLDKELVRKAMTEAGRLGKTVSLN